MAKDVLVLAREALSTRRAQESAFYPRPLIEALVTEVEQLRWLVRHVWDEIKNKSTWDPTPGEIQEWKP